MLDKLLSLMPYPLHPAVVHFPIALLVLGALLALIGIVWRNHSLQVFTAFIFVLGTVAAYYTDQTGGKAFEAYNTYHPEGYPVLRQHADNAHNLVRASYVTAGISFLLPLIYRKRKLNRFGQALLLIAAGVALYYVYQTGHHGGHLIYQELVKLPRLEGSL